LLALERGETHMGGTHLLDTASGFYNIPDIKKAIPNVPLVLVHLAQREQGILVRRGNPKLITGIKDLLKPGVRFVNRQPGSGTRVLFDHELKKLGIHPGAITGYEREEFTHMAVGVAISSNLADAGLGVRAAATALGLDFVPVGEEEYDLVVARRFYESERGAKLMKIIRSDGFKRAVAGLGGYDTRRAAEVLYQQ
jgi:putative molybdopterin biosynthesis protein